MGRPRLRPRATVRAAAPLLRVARPSEPVHARAYCGLAHHRHWEIPAHQPVGDDVELAVPTGTQRYRLVCNPRTGRPARDSRGALVFVPREEPY